jgi:hypothetical protein
VELEASWRDFLGGQANVHSGLTFGHQCIFFSSPSFLSLLIEFHTHLPKFKGVLSFVFVLKLVIFLMISIFFVFLLIFFNFIFHHLVSFNFYIEFGPHSFDYYLFFNHFPN